MIARIFCARGPSSSSSSSTATKSSLAAERVARVSARVHIFSELRIRAPTTNFHVSPGAFPRICISPLARPCYPRGKRKREGWGMGRETGRRRKRASVKLFRSFTVARARTEVFACNFLTVSPLAHIFPHFTDGALSLNGQIRPSHLNADVTGRGNAHLLRPSSLPLSPSWMCARPRRGCKS